MIKIKKSPEPPYPKDKKVENQLKKEIQSNNRLFDQDPNNYNSGVKKFEFNPKLYSHDVIKSELIKNQNGKCAFCEQNIIGISYGDVEHFRPKGGFKQNETEILSKPGYYWLAYDWNNLLLACQKCNQRYKKNIFPILNQSKRARTHHHSIKYEKPIFINPNEENPKFLIGFREEVAYGKDKKARGKKTIEALNLNREGSGYSDLVELRRDHYDLVESTYTLSKMTTDKIPQDIIDKAKRLMKEFKSNRKNFSALVRDNFKD